MKVQDFRIGNHVKFNGEIVVVCAIDEFSLMLRRKDGGLVPYPPAHIEPIRMTETEIQRCGFYLIKNAVSSNKFATHWSNDRLNKIANIIFYLEYCNFECLGDRRMSFTFTYLHELENIYYMCFGEELKYE